MSRVATEKSVAFGRRGHGTGKEKEKGGSASWVRARGVGEEERRSDVERIKRDGLQKRGGRREGGYKV